MIAVAPDSSFIPAALPLTELTALAAASVRLKPASSDRCRPSRSVILIIDGIQSLVLDGHVTRLGGGGYRGGRSLRRRMPSRPSDSIMDA